MLEYRVTSGEIGFEGEGSFEASGSMSIQRVSENFSNPVGIERWAAFYFATPAESMSEWIGDSRSTPDGLSLFLELRRLSWEKEGVARSFLGDELVGSAALHFELVPVPEPESALLLSLGLSFVAMGRRTRSRA